MTEQNSQIVPTPEIVIPPKPRPNAELIRDANYAIDYLTRFTASSRLDPELRMSFNNIANTIKFLKTTVVRMSEDAQANHDNLVEVVRSQRLTGS
jgi:hypothetical protein